MKVEDVEALAETVDYDTTARTQVPESHQRWRKAST